MLSGVSGTHMMRHHLTLLLGSAALAASVLVARPAATSAGATIQSGPSTVEAAAGPAACGGGGRAANLDFTLEDIHGRQVTLSAYRGKVILLDFWATWCAPCKVEIPGFVELYDKYRAQGFVMIGVSVDDPLDRLKPFVSQFRMNYPVLLGLGHDDLMAAFGPILGYPTAFLITRDGTVCTRHTGLTPKAEFEREIRGLL